MKTLLLAPLLLCGCLVVRHDFVSPDGSHDKSSLTAFMTTTKAAKLATHTSFSTNRYNHGSSGSDVVNTGDTATIEAITKLIQAVKPPIVP